MPALAAAKPATAGTTASAATPSQASGCSSSRAVHLPAADLPSHLPGVHQRAAAAPGAALATLAAAAAAAARHPASLLTTSAAVASAVSAVATPPSLAAS